MKRSLFPVLLLFPHISWALSLAMTSHEMARSADTVFLATVEKIVQPDTSRWKLEIHLQVSDGIKNATPGERRLLRLTGGIVNGRGIICSEIPVFREGESFLLFLTEGITDDRAFVGGVQGCLRVKDGMVMEKGVRLEAYLRYLRAGLSREEEQ